MFQTFYDIANAVARPLAIVWLAVSPKHRPLLARFAPYVPQTKDRPLWLHACSVGEVNTAIPLIDAFRQRHPQIPVVLTTSTIAGHELARDKCQGAYRLTWFPVDHRRIVRRFITALDPRALVLIETEIWPNVIKEARRHGAPVVMLSGRLSDKHVRRYERFKGLLGPVFAKITLAGMQNEKYRERIVALGTDPKAVCVTGNTKFDAVSSFVEPGWRGRLKEENGFAPGHPVLIFGSTCPGDEQLAADCWEALKDEIPNLRIILAPRHLRRLAEAAAPFNEGILRRTQIKRGLSHGDERIFLLDTMGELVQFYAAATVAVIGGSFFPGVDGHNPLEPAALGVPTVFGPHMLNFEDFARVLLKAGGAVQAPSPEDLLPTLKRLLSDSKARIDIAKKGRKAVEENKGAINKNLDLLDTVL